MFTNKNVIKKTFYFYTIQTVKFLSSVSKDNLIVKNPTKLCVLKYKTTKKSIKNEILFKIHPIIFF